MQREHDVGKAPLLDGAQVVAPIGIDVTHLKLLASHRQFGGALGVHEHLHRPDLIRRADGGTGRGQLLLVRGALGSRLDVQDPGVEHPFQLIFEDVERAGGGHHDQRERDDHSGIEVPPPNDSIQTVAGGGLPRVSRRRPGGSESVTARPWLFAQATWCSCGRRLGLRTLTWQRFKPILERRIHVHRRRNP